MRFQPIRVQRAVIGALLLDAIGSGLLGPLELVYGHLVVGLTLTEAGVALSFAAAGSIAIGPLAGTLVDRQGPRTLIVSANVVGALGCVGLLVARDVVAFAVASLLIASSVRIFWAAFSPFVSSVVASDALETWFGRLRATRQLGFTLGAGA